MRGSTTFSLHLWSGIVIIVQSALLRCFRTENRRQSFKFGCQKKSSSNSSNFNLCKIL